VNTSNGTPLQIGHAHTWNGFYNGLLGQIEIFNRALTAVTEQRAMPSKGRKRLKVYYISQYQTSPPRFAISINDRDLVTRDFGFFVENRLRAALDFAGVPLIIDFKER